MKKVGCFLLTIIIVLSSSMLVFADDLEDTSSSSSDEDRLATQEEIELMEADMRSASESLYILLSDNGTRATPHDVNDVYNLLWSYMFDTTFMNHGSNYPGLMYYRLNDVRNYCLSISQSASSMAVKLNDLYSSINPDYDTTGISIYDQLNAIATGLTSVDPNDGILTAVEALVYIYSNVEDIYDQMIINPNLTSNEVATAISNALQATLNLVNQHLANIDTDLVTLQNNLTLLYSELTAVSATNSQFLNDFNKITYGALDTSYIGYKLDLSDENWRTDSGLRNGYDIYFKFSYTTVQNYNLYKIGLPIRAYSAYRVNSFIDYIEIIYNDYPTIQITDFNYAFDTARNLTYIYLYDYAYPFEYDTIIHIHFTQRFRVNNVTPTFEFLRDDNIDFYTVYDYLTSKALMSALNKFVMLYASQDLIDAKNAQQDLEDQVLSDFTGLGSASASVSDAITAKQTSNAIKSGLNTGISSSYALSAFDNSSGLYIWFSQSVADWFTIPAPTRGTGSVNNQDYSNIIWSDDIPDMITPINNEYNQAINND